MRKDEEDEEGRGTRGGSVKIKDRDVNEQKRIIQRKKREEKKTDKGNKENETNTLKTNHKKLP